MVARSVTLTSPGQPGLSFARTCMTSQCITSWGLSSNGITSLCPTSWHTPSTRRDLPFGQVCPLVYIYKEGVSRTVVRELLPRATAQGHQTFPDYGRHARSRSKGGDVREEAPAEERAAKNLQTNARHLGFTEKLYGFPRTLLCCQYKRRTPTVVRELLPRTSTKRAQTFPTVARCTSHHYKMVDVLK